MGREREICRAGDLLDGRGRITEEGWARHPYWRYDRSRIKAPAFRIKEWDYYAVISHQDRFGVTLTYSDLGYAGLYALCWIDLADGTFAQADRIAPLTLHRTGLSGDPSKGNVATRHKDLSLELITAGEQRRLAFSAPELELPGGERGVEGEIVLTLPEDHESVNIATSWAEKRTAFYYNRKVNCLAARGAGRAGNRIWEMRPGDSFGCLDWGRGRWTYNNTWYWCSVSGKLEGVPVGCNLGYGFSDRTPASENGITYNGVIHKLGPVTFTFDEADVLKPWLFRDAAGRLSLAMNPIVDRHSDFDLGIISSRQHQVFGEFSGQVTLDDGTQLPIDRVLGFAEVVANRW